MGHVPVMEIKQVKKLNIPAASGCYQFFKDKGELIYIGKAANLRSRVYSYWRESANHTPAKQQMVAEIASIKWIETDSEIEALLLESNLVKKFQPYYNIDLRDDKRFSYIKVSLEDEIPGVFVTRKIDKAGKYCGPFTSGQAVKETVKALRKIWQYCTERRIKLKPCFFYQVGRCTGVCGGRYDLREYKEKIIKPIIMFIEGKKKVIIRNLEVKIRKLEKEIKYRQSSLTGNTAEAETSISKGGAKSAASISKIDKELITPLVKGDRGGVIRELEDELADLKFQLINMRKVLEHTKIIGVAEKYASDVAELAKALGLPHAPQRIEGYDISNIFGQEAVGSMVVFAKGEPDKDEYRKFKIRVGQGEANDVGMLKEVLERRLGHSIGAETSGRLSLRDSRGQTADSRIENIERGIGNEKFCKMRNAGLGIRNKGNVNQASENKIPNSESQILNSAKWPLPDLIIIDGGKAQLNAALRVLKNNKLDIPVIAVSKGEGLRSSLAPDKLFFPGQKKPLELPLASPALHIVKRVRDEAHRFAISYHRLLRKKKILNSY